jgi:hypothetical protein
MLSHASSLPGGPLPADGRAGARHDTKSVAGGVFHTAGRDGHSDRLGEASAHPLDGVQADAQALSGEFLYCRPSSRLAADQPCDRARRARLPDPAIGLRPDEIDAYLDAQLLAARAAHPQNGRPERQSPGIVGDPAKKFSEFFLATRLLDDGPASGKARGFPGDIPGGG